MAAAAQKPVPVQPPVAGKRQVAGTQWSQAPSQQTGSLHSPLQTKNPTKKAETGVPVVAQQIKNLTSIHEDTGVIPGLTQRVKDPALP